MYDEKTAERVRRSVSRLRNVQERKMMGTLSFMIDDALTCCVADRSLMVRVTPEERDAALAKPHVTSMKMGQREVRTFVLVAPAGFRTDAALRAWIERGRAAARSYGDKSTSGSARTGKTVKVRKTKRS